MSGEVGSAGLVLACSRCGEIFPDLDSLLGHLCPNAAPPPPVYEVDESPFVPRSAPSRTLAAIQAVARRVKRNNRIAKDARKRQRAVNRADKAAERAAIRATRDAERKARMDAAQAKRESRATRRAIEAADDYTPDPLPDSGAVPIHGPLPVANPSHPVRNPIRAARWRQVTAMPAAPIKYCACGFGLPLRPGPKCENCGRTL